MRRMAVLICVACLAVAGRTADAAKFAPLAEIKPLGRAAVYFNPDKIIAVFEGPLVTMTQETNPQAPVYRAGGVTTYVAGLEDQPTPVDQSPTAFLKSLSLEPLFVCATRTAIFM